jgi:hypothetical protein
MPSTLESIIGHVYQTNFLLHWLKPTTASVFTQRDEHHLRNHFPSFFAVTTTLNPSMTPKTSPASSRSCTACPSQ